MNRNNKFYVISAVVGSVVGAIGIMLGWNIWQITFYSIGMTAYFILIYCYLLFGG